MRKIIASLILAAFFANSCVPSSYAQVFMPKPGEMVSLSPAFHSSLLAGVKVYKNDPFRFDFILDKGQEAPSAFGVEAIAMRLIRYFLASLTVPEKDLWVNLSPYEKDRIVPDAFGLTGMGRDLLAQDYLLKQITSSLMYPEDELGKKFWSEIYQKAQEQFGTTDIPVDTFNKVWIVPSKAVVYERPAFAALHPDEVVAYVVESRLKVMLESDYEAAKGGGSKELLPTQELSQQVIRQVIIPALEKEVNEGRNFAPLRQVYNSLILASWYKKKIKESILSKVYVDRQKVRGINIDDPKEAEKIWGQYVEAFKKGVFDLVKEEKDQYTQEMVPRKYFSGGVTLMDVGGIAEIVNSVKDFKKIAPAGPLLIKMDLQAWPEAEWLGIDQLARFALQQLSEDGGMSLTRLGDREGQDEKYLFFNEGDFSMSSVDAAEDVVGNAAEAMHLLDRLMLFMKGRPIAVPHGIDTMKHFIDAFNKRGSPLSLYKDRMAEYLKDEEMLAFKLFPKDPGGSPTMLKIFLADEDPFDGRTWEEFDARVPSKDLDAFNKPVMVVDAKKAWSQGQRHWKWEGQSGRGSHWMDWDSEEAVGFIEQPYLEGKPTTEDVRLFKVRIESHGYKERGVGSIEGSIRCDLKDESRKFYLMDPSAVKKDKDDAMRSSLPAVLSGYNFVPEITVDMRRVMNDPDVRMDAENKAIDLQRLTDNYQRLGKLAGFNGKKVVYNPFGGADVLAPFTLARDARDVVSMGFEDFGSSKQISLFLTEAPVFLQSGGRLAAYDNHPQLYQEIAKTYGGIGALALARIIFQLKGDITAVHFFDINVNGDIQFVQEQGQENGKSAVVEFNVRDGRGVVVKKRFWYIQHDVYAGHALGVSSSLHKNPISLMQSDVVAKGFIDAKGMISQKFFDDREGFLDVMKRIVRDPQEAYERIAGMYRSYVAYKNFISKLAFDALLIKASLHAWSDYGRELVAELTLDPAKRNDAVVLNDQKSKVLESQEIWDQPPEMYTLGKGESFGYSQEGGHVFYGPASRLKSSADYAAIVLAKDQPLLSLDATGGIDLTTGSAELQATGSGAGRTFNFDPAEVRRLQNLPGFVPVIMDIQAMKDLPEFLGLVPAQLN